jgi:hypothetical protein
VDALAGTGDDVGERYWMIRPEPADAGRAGDVVDRLQHAVAARIRIEQAKGVLMEREGLDEATAFELLRHTARSSRRRVVAVAEKVLRGGAAEDPATP